MIWTAGTITGFTNVSFRWVVTDISEWVSEWEHCNINRQTYEWAFIDMTHHSRRVQVRRLWKESPEICQAWNGIQTHDLCAIPVKSSNMWAIKPTELQLRAGHFDKPKVDQSMNPKILYAIPYSIVVHIKFSVADERFQDTEVTFHVQ